MVKKIEVLHKAKFASFNPEGGSKETSLGEETTIPAEAPEATPGQ